MLGTVAQVRACAELKVVVDEGVHIFPWRVPENREPITNVVAVHEERVHVISVVVAGIAPEGHSCGRLTHTLEVPMGSLHLLQYTPPS
jgi:hypothetical protein